MTNEQPVVYQGENSQPVIMPGKRVFDAPSNGKPLPIVSPADTPVSPADTYLESAKRLIQRISLFFNSL